MNVIFYILITLSLFLVSSCCNNKYYSSRIPKEKQSRVIDPYNIYSYWDLKFLDQNKDLKNLLEKFIAGNYAEKSYSLRLYNKSKKEIKKILFENGFTHDKITSTKDSGDIYIHQDGSGVRIKDKDLMRKFRTQAYVVKFVLYNPKKPATWQNEAFKVSNEGYPIPKSTEVNSGIKILDNSIFSETEITKWMDTIMDKAHINIACEFKE